jgi:phosphatidylethanolamine/phosphatidyl-N-methylethanolamine N-methyltransferase
MSSDILTQTISFSRDTLSIDITQRYLHWSIFHAFLNFAFWILLPHLEFKYKLLSRFTNGDQGKACDFLSFLLIQTGALRNLTFNEAVNENIKISYGYLDIPLEILGFIMMAAGGLLILITFYRMGIRGMYFGDHFGFLFTEKITAFPFNYLDNPQYVGTTTFFLGSSIFYHSPAGVFLTLLTYALYMILNVIESKKLNIFYPPAQKKSN